MTQFKQDLNSYGIPASDNTSSRSFMFTHRKYYSLKTGKEKKNRKLGSFLLQTENCLFLSHRTVHPIDSFHKRRMINYAKLSQSEKYSRLSSFPVTLIDNNFSF